MWIGITMIPPNQMENEKCQMTNDKLLFRGKKGRRSRRDRSDGADRHQPMKWDSSLVRETIALVGSDRICQRIWAMSSNL